MAQTQNSGVLPMSTARNAGQPKNAPHRHEIITHPAELELTGSLLNHPECLADCDFLTPEDFAERRHADAVGCIHVLVQRGAEVSPFAIANLLGKTPPDVANIYGYLDLLKRDYGIYSANFKPRALSMRRAALDRKIEQALTRRDAATVAELVRQKETYAEVGKEPEGLALEHADTLTLKAVQWLWKDWLARGKLHLLAGLPGTGKTTLALALAATVSSGGRFPDGSTAKPGRVVIWSSEDDVEDTLLPRLVANGADRRRIAFCRTVREQGKPRLFDPATDLPLLQAALEKLGDTDLVILDSIADTVTGDSHKNAEVRRALFPVKELAEAAHLAVLGIAHFNKSVGSDAMSRIVGSIGFAGMARLVMVAFAHPEHGHLLMRAKSNLGLDHGGYQYEIQQTPLHDHPGIEASLVLWGTRVEGNATDLLRQAETGDDRPTEGDSGDWGVQLLTDLHAYFADRTASSYPTTELLRYLTEIDDAPWSTYAKGKAMTPRHLAGLLHPYGILPQTIRVSETATPKGYTVADFGDAFARYLPSIRNIRNTATSTSSTGKSPDSVSATIRNVSATIDVCSGNESVANVADVADVADCGGNEFASSASQTAGCGGVADVADKNRVADVADRQPPPAQPVDNFSAKPLPPLTTCSDPTPNADPTGCTNGSAVKQTPPNGNRWGTLQTTLWWDDETPPPLLSRRKRRQHPGGIPRPD
jgi:putative DNA primase/helicase